MYFIDLHQDLINYFTDKRKFLQMKYSDFRKKECVYRHADLETYLDVQTKILFCSVFPLTLLDGKWQSVKPKDEIKKQLDFYHRFVEKYNEFYVIRDRYDIEKNFSQKNRIGIILHMEGADAIESIEDVKRYYEQGIRSIALTWNNENQLAGGLDSAVGLTDFGKEVLTEMKNYHFILDMVHLNKKSFSQIAKIWKHRMMASHTAVKKIYDHPQNVDRAQIRQVIKHQGLVGISFLKSFYGHKAVSIGNVVEHLNYFRKKYGTCNIAIGTDFFGFSLDDNVSGLNNLAKIADLASRLQKAGWEKSELENLFWRNAYNFIINTLS